MLFLFDILLWLRVYPQVVPSLQLRLSGDCFCWWHAVPHQLRRRFVLAGCRSLYQCVKFALQVDYQEVRCAWEQFIALILLFILKLTDGNLLVSLLRRKIPSIIDCSSLRSSRLLGDIFSITTFLAWDRTMYDWLCWSSFFRLGFSAYSRLLPLSSISNYLQVSLMMSGNKHRTSQVKSDISTSRPVPYNLR